MSNKSQDVGLPEASAHDNPATNYLVGLPAEMPRDPTYIEVVADAIAKLLRSEGAKSGDYIWPPTNPSTGDEHLLDLYALLALTTGTETSAENVHDAWSVYARIYESDHTSVRPFHLLRQATQAKDEPYARVIRAVAHWLEVDRIVAHS